MISLIMRRRGRAAYTHIKISRESKIVILYKKKALEKNSDTDFEYFVISNIAIRFVFCVSIDYFNLTIREHLFKFSCIFARDLKNFSIYRSLASKQYHSGNW